MTISILSEHQRKIVDAWSSMYPDRTKFSDYIFDNNDRLYINLENSNNTINPNVTIKQFLTNNDYTIYDYGKGIALDKYNRKIRIGKILRKLNFEEQLTKLFTNDKSRNNVNNINLKMCITRNPYDVAAMSVNRGWNSCMNMSGGSHARKIEDAIRVGTHVAYLIHNTDDNILRPIARILLNPYHSENNHTILFPEKLYGTGNNTFIESTYNWCKSMFPLKDTYYKKDNNIYNDNNKIFVVNDNEDSEYILFTGSSFHRGLLASNTINFDYLLELSKDNSRWIKCNVAARHYKEINDYLITDSDKYVRRTIALTGDLEYLNILVFDNESIVRAAVATFGCTEHLNHLIRDNDVVVKQTVAMYGKENHLNILLSDINPSVRKYVALYGTKDQAIKLINDSSIMVKMCAIKRMNFVNPIRVQKLDWINIPNEDELWQQ